MKGMRIGVYLKAPAMITNLRLPPLPPKNVPFLTLFVSFKISVSKIWMTVDVLYGVLAA